MNQPADHRGAIEIELGGIKLKMVPSFENLQAMERATGKGCILLYQQARMGNVVLSDIAAGITVVAKPADKADKLPKEWSVGYVGQAILEEGFDTFVAAFCRWLNTTMSAGPKKVGGEESSGE